MITAGVDLGTQSGDSVPVISRFFLKHFSASFQLPATQVCPNYTEHLAAYENSDSRTTLNGLSP